MLPAWCCYFLILRKCGSSAHQLPSVVLADSVLLGKLDVCVHALIVAGILRQVGVCLDHFPLIVLLVLRPDRIGECRPRRLRPRLITTHDLVDGRLWISTFEAFYALAKCFEFLLYALSHE